MTKTLEAHEFWLEDVKLSPAGDVACPISGGLQFTVRTSEYGIQLACWNEPTFIGIRRDHA